MDAASKPRVPPPQPGRTVAEPDLEEMLRSAAALQKLGRLEEAQQTCDRMLTEHPQDPPVLLLCGLLALQTGHFLQALSLLDESIRINPESPEPHLNRAGALEKLGRLEEAICSCEVAIALKPGAPAHYLQARLLTEQGQAAAALATYDRLIALDPEHALAYASRGALLNQLGNFEAALDSLDLALLINPELAQAHSNRGNALLELGQPVAAVTSYDKAIQIKPDFSDAYSNRGAALAAIGDSIAALESLDRAIQLHPVDSAAWHNRGNVLREMGQVEEAARSFERAIAIKPDYKEACYNLAICLLLSAQFIRGFQLYEWRWKAVAMAHTLRNFECPQWMGTLELAGKTILLHAEQGLGDSIQFVRYVRQVAQLASAVILEVQAPLIALFAGLQSTAKLVAKGEPLPAFDTHCPLLSLPLALGTDRHTIPAETPYLHGSSQRVLYWKQKISQATFNVGICWQGSTAGAVDKGRSFPLTYFERIARISGVQLLSLQKNEGREQLKSTAIGAKILDLGAELDLDGAFLDTAAIITNLDLVITSDTAIAHLAGALGCQVWVALKHVPDWRWMLHGKDSPWYPSMRLFRQPSPGDWYAVFDEMHQALIKSASKIAAPKAALKPLPASPRASTSHDEQDAPITITDPDAAHRLAAAELKIGNYSRALELASTALQVHPQVAALHGCKAMALHKLGNYADALENYANAIHLAPESIDHHLNCGNTLQALGRLMAAVEQFDAAIAISPRYAPAHSNRANALTLLKQYADAIASHQDAISLDPLGAQHHYNLAVCLHQQGDIHRAITNYTKAISISPNYEQAIYNRSICLLLSGNLEDGFRDYESRWRSEGSASAGRHFAAPIWLGEQSLAGKTILVHSEQGLGDTLQMFRYLRKFRSLNAHVAFEVEPQLIALLSQSSADAPLFIAKGDPLPPVDFHCPLLSLPLAFKTRLGTIPAASRYLSAAQSRIDHWSKILGSSGFKIGISWHGRDSALGVGRSFPLRLLESISGIAGIRLISLQQREGVEQLNNIPAAMQVEHLGDQIDQGNDAFVDSAAILSLMDLVITCDTSIAHLAGALGRPVWVALKHTPDWRWLLERQDSPWYPSMSLFRQEAQDDWTGIFQKMYRRLSSKEFNFAPLKTPILSCRVASGRVPSSAHTGALTAVDPTIESPLPPEQSDRNLKDRPMKLNLGCGFNKQEGYVNVDMYDACSPNVLHNLEIFPWPFSDSSADEILFNHSLEHLGQQSDVFLKIMQETYRVAKDGATVYINVPHPRHDNFISDPTHVRAITPMTLQLFDLDLNRHWQKTGAANSPLAIYLNVNFKLIHTNITLEPEQLEELQAGRLSNQQISDLIKRSNNIASEYRFTLKVVK